MDFPRVLGGVPARRGMDAEVRLADDRTVLVALLSRHWSACEEHYYDASQAGELDALLRGAAETVNQPGVVNDEIIEIGAVRTGKDEERTEVLAHWPLVVVRWYYWRGNAQLALEFTPGRANLLADLLDEGADALNQ
jgi:hypothetical protein